jgi:hypothetical protein
MLVAAASHIKTMFKSIYVRLLNEGTDVYRPAVAHEIEHGIYEILPTADYDAADEEWEFPPESHVRIEKRESEDGDHFIAISP